MIQELDKRDFKVQQQSDHRRTTLNFIILRDSVSELEAAVF